jgi:hypothetical protein
MALAMLAVAAIVLLWLGPIMTIWSLNLLFGLSIPITLKTWAATLWLIACIGGSSQSSRRR